jgi:hypothetical protein
VSLTLDCKVEVLQDVLVGHSEEAMVLLKVAKEQYYQLDADRTTTLG